MPSDIIPTKRVPQSDDGVQALLAKLLSVQSQRVTGTSLASAVRSSTTQSSDIDANGFHRLVAFLIVSVAGTGTLTLRVRGRNPVNGVQFILRSAPTVSSTANITYTFGPGAELPTVLSDVIRIEISHSDASDWTYSVGYCLVP
jgi:hypothetical protein